MSNKILVDTSAWISSFKESGNSEMQNLLRNFLAGDTVAITDLIILELLQGCKSKKEYKELLGRLEILSYYPITKETWNIANNSSFLLRRKGITIPTVDIIICSIAKENNLPVLHHDKHIKVISAEMNIPSIDFL